MSAETLNLFDGDGQPEERPEASRICINPDCEKPATTPVSVFGQRLSGLACYECAHAVARAGRVRREQTRMPVEHPSTPRPGLARGDQPETSKAAANTNLLRRGTQRTRILDAHIAHPDGLTDEEAADLAGIPPRSTPWRRCGELRDHGYLEDSGMRRKTTSGAESVVWRVTDSARRAWGELREP